MIRHMLHDPNVYPDPLKFKPERFLAAGDNPPQPDPYDAFFGFGRRYVR
jgi:cytochrome P450